MANIAKDSPLDQATSRKYPRGRSPITKRTPKRDIKHPPLPPELFGAVGDKGGLDILADMAHLPFWCMRKSPGSDRPVSFLSVDLWLLAIRYLQYAICYQLFAISHSPLAIRYLPFAIRYLPPFRP